MAYDRIYPGKLWLDTDGKLIQAHGFSVFYNKKDGLYYWYGENKEKTRGGPFNKVWHWGVRWILVTAVVSGSSGSGSTQRSFFTPGACNGAPFENYQITQPLSRL